MSHSLEIRIFKPEDLSDVQSLCTQLGYNTNLEKVTARIEAIISNSDHNIIIAVLEKKVVGFLHSFRALRISSPEFSEIAGLVIDEAHRRNGIGRALIRDFESRQNGQQTRVRCNVKRATAHLFYKSLSFSEIKEQKVFTKG